jgi:heat shock protein HtpX
MMILAPLAALVIQAAISRSREYNADTEGATLAGDPMHLASALEKLNLIREADPPGANPAYSSMFIVQPLNPFRGMANVFSTHPPMEKRLMNLIGP